MRVPVSAGLVLAAAATLAACASVTARPASRPHAHPSGSPAARTYRVRPRAAGPRPPSLAEAAGWYAAGPTSLEKYQLFALAQPVDASAAFLAERVPADMGSGATGQGSGPDGAWFTQVSYLPRTVPAGVYGAQLVLTVVSAGSGGSLLRADAQATWYPPRTAAEYIDPARYHVLTITVTVGGSDRTRCTPS